MLGAFEEGLHATREAPHRSMQSAVPAPCRTSHDLQHRSHPHCRHRCVRCNGNNECFVTVIGYLIDLP